MSIKINDVEVSVATVAYLRTILWAETVCLPMAEEWLIDGCMDVPYEHRLYDVRDMEPLDRYFNLDDFTADAIQRAEADCSAFFDRMISSGLYGQASLFACDEQIARDFWLTRQGHGAGFWDGDYAAGSVDIGDALSAIAKEFGETYACIGDDGYIDL
jgi:hypothetical protein